MPTRQLLIVGLLILFLLGICQGVVYYPQLPDPMATHFDAAGKPNGFSNKLVYTFLMIGIQGGLIVMYLVFDFAGRKLPASLINMPNKDYWLAPERKEQTIRRLVNTVYVIGVGTQIFLMATNQLAIMENLGTNGMDWFWWILSLYLVFIFGFVITYYFQFRLPPDAINPPE